jgi:hypothetical protein
MMGFNGVGNSPRLQRGASRKLEASGKLCLYSWAEKAESL